MSSEPQEQHLFLKCLLEANVDGILAFDGDCRFTTWNRAMERISGVKRDDVLGKRASEVFPCLQETGDEKYYFEALAGRSVVAEARPYIVAQTGKHGYYDGYYSPRHDENGEVIGGVAIIRDVTERQLAEASALDDHKRLAFHVENTPLAVIEWNHEFKVLRWSPAAQRLFGWKADEVLGRHFSEWEFVVPEDLDAVNQIGQRQNDGYERHGISRNRNYTKLGNILHCEWYNSALYSDTGKLISVLSLVLDVTVAKRIEEALRKSEMQYRLLFESNPQPMWVYDVETLRFLAVNEAAIQRYGYSRTDFLEMTIADIRPAEDGQLLSDYLASDDAEIEHAGEWRHRKKDGTVIHVEITASRLTFAGRRAEFVLAQDITERKQAETALRISEDRCRDLVDNSHELICTHDLDGKVLSVNPWAARVLGYPRERLIGMNIRDGLLPEYRAEFDKYLSAMKSEGSARGVMKVRTATGETRLWEYYNTLRTDGVETPIVRGMAHDVTERREALKREKEARLEAEAANRVKDEFLSTLSHELRTPLTAIVGWSDLLLHDEVAPHKQREAIATIARNANSQGQLINDLLEVSRIITGKLRLEFAACELESIIQAAVEAVRPTAEAKGVKLQILLEPDTGPVLGDRERLQQIVWNLLSNGVKFTRQNGLVQIKLQRVESQVEVVVTDSGVGINPEFLPYVFERFRQADGSTTRNYGGLGLGLAIVRHLVELHGGTVAADSAGANKGAVFTVRFPAMVESISQQFELMELVTSPVAVAESRNRQQRLGGLRVLVVDDEFDARALVTTMLEGSGAQVLAVSSAAEALDSMESWKPDVLIADIGMPVEDGYGLIRKVRALPQEVGGKTPAVALTAYARSDDRKRALAEGYQVHLAKPVDRVELATVIGRLFEGTALPKSK
jgi:PAS domain S-box-containing protein